VAVDWKTGDDSVGCCGVGSTNKPCETLTRAMALIGEAQATGVTVNATVNGAGGDWAPATIETYPVQLGWGVELSAPGVFFADVVDTVNGTFRNEIFDVAVLGTGATDYASIVGGAKPIGVGMNSTNATNSDQTGDTSAISVEANSTLYIANASVNGSAINPNSSQTFLVNPGATLVLGQDQSATITGTVTIGNALGQSGTNGYVGINCMSDFISLGCTIQDATLKGQSSVVIEGQESVDLEANDFSTVTLTSTPMIGVPPVATGFTDVKNGVGCATKLDEQGHPSDALAVLLSGPVTMTFNNGAVQCIGGAGFGLSSSGNGSPTLSIDSTTIQNTNFGIDAQAGKATVTNTTINYNYRGVVQEPDPNVNTNNGTIDLTGGGNTVVCSSNAESSRKTTSPGIDVWNISNASLAADNVAWDTTQPDYFSCDNAFANCTCNLTTCTTTAGSDDMDAVEDSTNLGGITTTGNTQAAVVCN
jgi:hypothetical protein